MISPTLATVLAAFERCEPVDAVASFSEDATYVEARKDAIRGRTAIAAEFARFGATGVPYRFTFDDVIAEGARACVVYRFAVGGGDGEPWRERAGCATVRFDERGQIEEWREYEG
jgi:ketosteroid isomerase-like protein